MLRRFWLWFWSGGAAVTPAITDFECDFNNTLDFEANFIPKEIIDFTCKFSQTVDMEINFE